MRQRPSSRPPSGASGAWLPMSIPACGVRRLTLRVHQRHRMCRISSVKSGIRRELPEEEAEPHPLFRADGTYLITGGLGGVRLRTAQWMVEQGARHLVLMGRRGATDHAQETIDALRSTGAVISVA